MNLHRSIASLGVTLALLFAAPVHAAVPPAEKLLPADTLAVLTIPDWIAATTAAKEIPFVQLWRDPAMKAFTEKVEGKLREFVGQEDKDFAQDWEEFKPLLNGQVTIAVVRNDWQGELNSGPDVVAFLDVKDKEKQLRAFIEKCEKRDADAGKTIQRETVRGVKFARTLAKDAAKKQDDEAAAKKKTQPYVGQSGSLLLLSESAKALEKVLARLDGAGAGLDEEPAFQRARTTVGRDAQAFGWVNVKALVSVLAKAPGAGAGGDANPLGVAPMQILNALGLGGVDGAVLALRQAGDGSHVEVFIQAPEVRRKGLLAIFAPEPKEAGPLPTVSSDTAKFTRIRIDGQKAFATIERMVADLNPQMAGVVALMLESVGKDKDPNFDLRKEVFGNLGADFVTIEKSPRTMKAQDLSAQPTLYLIGSPRPDALVKALRTVNPLPMTEREFLGRKIYSFQMVPGLGLVPGQPGQMSFTTAGGYLAISTDAAMVEELLRGAEGQGKPLSGLAGLAEAAQQVGGFNTGWFSYANQNDTMRLLLETLKKDPAAIDKMFAVPVPIGGAALPSLQPLKELFDFALLPPFEVVSKYFGFAVQATAGTPEGISFKTFIPATAASKK